MIVVDASAAVTALVRAGVTRERIAGDSLHAPHLIDTEVVDALRKLTQREAVSAGDAEVAVTAWRRIGVTRYPTVGMLDRIWALRSNVSAYDAAYVALAETLECPLLTADRRLAAASGLRCSIELVPR